MGQRSAFFFVQDNGNVQATSIHWSTIPDATMGHFFASNRRDGIAPKDSLKQIVNAMSKQLHISSLEIQDKSSKFFDNNQEAIELGHDVALVSPQGTSPNEFHRAGVEKEMFEYLDGGSVGITTYESSPELVKFYWIDDNTGNMDSVELTVTELADFYENLMTEEKLMPINGRQSFRTKEFAK